MKPESPPLYMATLTVDGQKLAAGVVNWSENHKDMAFWPISKRPLGTQYPQATLTLEGMEKQPIQIKDLRECSDGSDHWDFET